MQTKWQVVREAVANTGSAFFLSLLAHKFLVSEGLIWYADRGGDTTDWIAAACVTIFYTALSLARNILIRSFFNRKKL